MGIPYNLEDTTLVRTAMEKKVEQGRQEGREEGRQEGRLDAIIAIMRARFDGDAPVDLRARLQKLSQQELADVTVRAATATSAEDALAMPAGGSPGIAPRQTG